MEVDALIFGGGGAGLWLLDALHASGFSTLLIERTALGAGQTIACQGIIHGGIKYTLTGSMTASARAIRDMPDLWRACLRGEREPDLRDVRVLSPGCHLWRTRSLTSKLGLVGTRVGLRSEVSAVDRADRPAVLAECPGDVLRVDEPVLDVPSLIRVLANRHAARIIAVGEDGEVAIETSGAGRVAGVALRRGRASVDIHPRHVILTAGAGNEELRQRVGLPANAMQRRPLHMVLVRGSLPMLFGHCVDGARTRVTITSATDSASRTVWQLGGNLSEEGVGRDADAQVAHARRELASVLPGLNLDATEWGSYRIDRAEGRTAGGLRPQGPTVGVEGNTITAWPTKLALVPQLATMVAEHLGLPARPVDRPDAALSGFLSPSVALPPWETVSPWRG